MFRIATSPIAPLLGQRLPVRARTHLLNRSYLRMQRATGQTERVLTTSAGDLFRADLDSFQEWHRWVYGPLEDNLAQLFFCLVQPGAVCVDVGAGIGLHTVRLAKLAGPAGEVIAVEPDAEMARRAAENIALNGLANARVIPAAVSSAFVAAALSPIGQPAAAQSITIDEACQGPVSLMKINAEGREAAVVAGAAATIKRDRPAVVLEYAPSTLAGHAEDSFEYLADAGYLLYRINSRRNRLSGRRPLRLDPLYAPPEIGGRVLAVSESDAPRIISLVAFRDGRT